MLDEVEGVYSFCEVERSFCLSGDNKFQGGYVFDGVEGYWGVFVEAERRMKLLCMRLEGGTQGVCPQYYTMNFEPWGFSDKITELVVDTLS